METRLRREGRVWRVRPRRRLAIRLTGAGERDADEASAWHAVDVRDALARLGADPGVGLSDDEAQSRRRAVGRNELVDLGRPSVLALARRQFSNVLVLVLAAAAGLAALIGEGWEAGAILAILLLNGVLGFFQEWRSEQALSALKSLLAPRCRVLRDGAVREIDAAELVPGDIVEIAAGDRIPADLRIIEAVNLQTDEAALTGESTPVDKSTAPSPERTPISGRTSMGWLGATVVNGRGRGLVVETGMRTAFGRIAALTQSVDRRPSPLQIKLDHLGKQLGALALAVAVAITIYGASVGRDMVEMALTAISLAVAAVPEGLPTVVTITLALGVGALARKQALPRRLQAPEALGASSFICTDKTGTLTRNEMTVTRIWTPDAAVSVTGVGYGPEGEFIGAAGRPVDPHATGAVGDLLRTAIIASHAGVVERNGEYFADGDPTESALAAAAAKAGLHDRAKERQVFEASFDGERKRMTVVVAEAGERIAHMKGAPEVVLARSDKIQMNHEERHLTADFRESILREFQALADDGLRTLAFARRRLGPAAALEADAVETELTFLGIAGIIDPPRPDVPDALRTARGAGLKVVMITGDAAGTAAAIARQIGLPVERVLTGIELEAIDDDELTAALQAEALLARVSPEDKMRIVRILQEDGEIVAMTGDGVNDAPALRRADVGVAMGVRGTDVAKAASDMILIDDNFSNIVRAIEEGRRQFDNIKKFVRYLVSSNVGEVIAVTASVFIGGPLILLPVQILWMNFVTDGVTALALGAERAEPDVMARPPRGAGDGFLNGIGLATVLLFGGYIGAVALHLYYSYLWSSDPDAAAKAQTVAFSALVVMQKIFVLNFRSLRAPMWRNSPFSNRALMAAIAATLALHAAAVYAPPLQRVLNTVPLDGADWLLIAVLATPLFVFVEIVKGVGAGARSLRGRANR